MAASGCCVTGESLIKIYPSKEAKQGKEISIKEFFHTFDSNEEYFIDSFTPRVLQMDRKKIINPISNMYSGGMIRFIMDIENEISLLCTEDHKFPMEIDGEYFVGKANQCSVWTLFHFFDKGKTIKQKVKAIVTFDVENLEVFNLAIEGESRYSDGFYIDQATGLIHHV